VSTIDLRFFLLLWPTGSLPSFIAVRVFNAERAGMAGDGVKSL